MVEREFGPWCLLGEEEAPYLYSTKKLAVLGRLLGVQNNSEWSGFFQTLRIIQTVPGHSEWLTKLEEGVTSTIPMSRDPGFREGRRRWWTTQLDRTRKLDLPRFRALHGR